MTMDMEFAHIDGYYGVKVYNVIYDVNDPEKTPIAYWTPLHGRWIKDDRSGKIYPCDEEYSNPLTREKIDNQSEEEYKKSSESFKKDGIPGIYHDQFSRPIKINIRATPLLITEKELPPKEKKKDVR